ncbi:hypothetical protein [Nonomuraea sediminis]|uniref:hypothetical protein n=1 Tax=Nonomuraea sediminis TaxID=2835864 RepID=UPI001BDD746C|nr:hypothetical protein [Nonomuraea sediminis]
MPDFQFNVAKGRTTELYNRVKIGDPAGSALIVLALAAANVETDAVLKDKDTLADVLGGATDEATNTGYSRKVLVAADLNPVVPDDVNDWVDLSIPGQTWANVQPGSNWSKILVCYRPAAASPDSAIVPLTSHDFPINPDGSNVVAQVDPSGFFRAV